MPRSPEDQDAPQPRLDDRVVEVLSESSGRIAFSGLRRALDAHPESLTRALRRLLRDGLIQREDGGYQLVPSLGRETEPIPRSDVRELASVVLAPGTSREEIFGRLSGRWFGRLRWVGVYDHPGDPWLVWSVEGSSSQVMLSVRAGRLRTLVSAGPARSRMEVDDASYALLGHALEGLRRTHPANPPTVATLSSEESLGPDIAS